MVERQLYWILKLSLRNEPLTRSARSKESPSRWVLKMSIFPRLSQYVTISRVCPHLNIRDPGAPKSLCIYAEPYPEVKLHWTASKFIERIRYWLAKTAENQLHPADQPLEPLLAIPFGTLVVPETLRLESNDEADPFYLWSTDPVAPGAVWVALRAPPQPSERKFHTHLLATFTCPVRSHGIISTNPAHPGAVI